MQLNTARSLLGVIATAVVVVGCSQSSLMPTSPSSSLQSASSALTTDQLAGTWKLVSISVADGTEQAAPAGADYSLTIADGHLSTRADCNLCGGSFKLSGQTVTAGPALACTRAACATMAFENAYTSLLAGDSTVTLTNNSLTLSSARGTLRFSR